MSILSTFGRIGYMDRELLIKSLRGTLDEKEEVLLKQWLEVSDEHRSYYIALQKMGRQKRKIPVTSADVERNYQRFLFQNRKRDFKRRIYRMCKIAAVILLLLVPVYWGYDRLQEEVVEPSFAEVPETARAILRVGNRDTFLIQGEAVKQLERQGGIILQQQEDIVNYLVIKDSLIAEPEWHVLEIPHGAEFQLELEDHSKVWVNAETSLQYLVPFSEKERRVRLSGEAYFQIAKSEIPFIVEFGGNEIKVLGTEFDVKAYEDDGMALATLVQGQIALKVAGDSCVLHPGEQARIYDRKMEIVNVDVAKHIAWKDGVLAFEDEPLENIMMELMRWYDIEIFYESNALKTIRFTGYINRYEDVSVLLKKTILK